MEHKDDGAEVVDLDVFYGERYEFQVGLANVGNITVEELELRSAIQFCREFHGICLIIHNKSYGPCPHLHRLGRHSGYSDRQSLSPKEDLLYSNHRIVE